MLRKIAKMGADTLSKPAEPVREPTAPEIRALAQDMIETCEDIGAGGIAATQVYAPLRLFVYRVRADLIPEGATLKPRSWTVVVNPEIIPQSSEKKVFMERCLSLPGLCGPVPRYTHVLCRGTTLEGEPLEIDARAKESMILQHEYDHLDGILYPMRMDDISKLAFVDECFGAPAYPLPISLEDYMV
ncbi:MAG: peptide deformylase [Kiloniellales bacterium]|nr:peptide deformylase [Kiloniellales bacterium]